MPLNTSDLANLKESLEINLSFYGGKADSPQKQSAKLMVEMVREAMDKGGVVSEQQEEAIIAIGEMNGVRVRKSSGSGCFIATAAYGTSLASEVKVLRHFRDTVLLESFYGRLFVSSYYKFSPPIARKVEGSQKLQQVIRTLFLDHLVRLVRRFTSNVS